MATIVLVADVVVAHVVRERTRFELSEGFAQKLLAKLDENKNRLDVDVAELKDLLNNTGEISSMVALRGQQADVRELLAALAISAWDHEIPSTVDETEYSGRKEMHFEGFHDAYIKQAN